MAEVHAVTSPAAQASPVAVFKKRAAKPKATIRKRPATLQPSASNTDFSDTSDDDDSGHRVKRRRKDGVVATSAKPQGVNARDLKPTEFAANTSAKIDTTNDATRHSNWYDESAQDALSTNNLLGNSRDKNKRDNKLDNKPSSIVHEKEKASERKVGPVKAPANIRTITIMDMAPDGKSLECRPPLT